MMLVKADYKPDILCPHCSGPSDLEETWECGTGGLMSGDVQCPYCGSVLDVSYKIKYSAVLMEEHNKHIDDEEEVEPYINEPPRIA